ncbi:reverse transcriptase [Gossypium australe]|uniref:Reverse transcriptase n=1 Tax=Gossypium australe TaxID=47621 RepID=A0A5B6WK03_9ROSI|nr:reverse transcriptase [Gossypium australe]
MHLGGAKKHCDFRESMKREIVKYVAKCLTCQQVKASTKFPLDCYTLSLFRSGNRSRLQWIL